MNTTKRRRFVGQLNLRAPVGHGLKGHIAIEIDGDRTTVTVADSGRLWALEGRERSSSNPEVARFLRLVLRDLDATATHLAADPASIAPAVDGPRSACPACNGEGYYMCDLCFGEGIVSHARAQSWRGSFTCLVDRPKRYAA